MSIIPPPRQSHEHIYEGQDYRPWRLTLAQGWIAYEPRSIRMLKAIGKELNNCLDKDLFARSYMEMLMKPACFEFAVLSDAKRFMHVLLFAETTWDFPGRFETKLCLGKNSDAPIANYYEPVFDFVTQMGWQFELGVNDPSIVGKNGMVAHENTKPMLEAYKASQPNQPQRRHERAAFATAHL